MIWSTEQGWTPFVQLAKLFQGSNNVMCMKVPLAVSSVCNDGHKEKAESVNPSCCCSAVSDSFVTLWTVAHQSPLSLGFPRQESWSGLPFPSPGDLPHPDWTCVPCFGRCVLYLHKGSPSGFPYCLQFKPEFCNKELMIWATVSSRSWFYWL